MHDLVSNEIKTYTNNIPHTWDFSVHCKDAQHSPKRNKIMESAYKYQQVTS